MSNTKTIFIIDDDPVYQFAIKRVLKTQGADHKILSFEDGEEAIDFITENSDKNENLPDIIFLDINMPILDGWQFLEEYNLIKSNISKKISIYMISSSVHTADLEKAKMIKEISDYLIKPITPDRLQELLAGLDKVA